MDNIVHLDEYRIKRDLKKVQTAIATARALIADGIAVPKNILPRLRGIEEKLEKQLEALFEVGEKNT
jgi:hypothetical protein